MDYVKKEKSKATPVTCSTCGITMSSEITAQQHFRGKAHAKMLHKKKESEKGNSEANEGIDSVQDTAELTPVVTKKVKPTTEPVHCSTCGITMSSDVTAQAHFAGKSHNKMLQKLKRKFTDLECTLCTIVFNSEEQSELHFQGKKHAKKMKQVSQLAKEASMATEPPEKLQKIETEDDNTEQEQ